METPTKEPEVPMTNDSAAAAVAPIDPENDIQAKTTVIWLVACAIGVFVSLWALKGLFSFAIQGERSAKIETIPAQELEKLRGEEAKLLAPATGKKIEDSIQEYLKK